MSMSNHPNPNLNPAIGNLHHVQRQHKNLPSTFEFFSPFNMGVASRKRMKPSVKRKKKTARPSVHALVSSFRREARPDAQGLALDLSKQRATVEKQFELAGLSFDANSTKRKRTDVADDDAVKAAAKKPAVAAASSDAPQTPASTVAGTILPEPLPERKSTPKMNQYDARYLDALRRKYGEDFAAMRRDHKLNYDQFTEAQLRKKFVLLETCWPAGKQIPDFSVVGETEVLLDLLADQFVADGRQPKATKALASNATVAAVAAAASSSSSSSSLSSSSSTSAPTTHAQKRAAARQLKERV